MHDFWCVIGNYVVKNSPLLDIIQIGKHLYFMENEKGWIKIGRSNNPEQRRRDLEFETGFKIKLIKVTKNQGKEELNLHRLFKKQRISFYNVLGEKSREWFTPSEELINLIKNYGCSTGK